MLSGIETEVEEEEEDEEEEEEEEGRASVASAAAAAASWAIWWWRALTGRYDTQIFPVLTLQMISFVHYPFS